MVDDGSTDGTLEAVAAEFPQIRAIRGDGSLFYAQGMNRAIEAALADKPRFLLLINDDSSFARDFLTELIDTAVSHPRSVVGALLLREDLPERVYQCDPRWDPSRGDCIWPEYRYGRNVPLQAWAVLTLAGNCVLVPRAAVETQGLMDAKRFPQYGDVEFMTRLRQAGWTLLVEPRAHVWVRPNTVAVLSTLRPREVLRRLLIDKHSPYYILHQTRRIFCLAPTRTAALCGLLVFWSRYCMHALSKAWSRSVERTIC
jgi:GT2 family glycosyltransferase